MNSDGLGSQGGRRGLRMDHVCEREISRGRDVAFAAGQGKILLLNFVWSDLKKAGPASCHFQQKWTPHAT
jgi:hypothetical protein